MARRNVPVSLIIPDASPLLSLGRAGHLDVLNVFIIPVHIVDVVAEEAKRPVNDTNGAVRAWLDGAPNNVAIVETNVGLGLQQRRARGEHPPTGNLGEIAVDEYATSLALQGDPANIPLVLFEDPDVLELRVARLAHVHLINTAALLTNLQALGVIDNADDIINEINGLRKTPMKPIEKPARSARMQSSLRRAVKPA